jgi:hypothetical protein
MELLLSVLMELHGEFSLAFSLILPTILRSTICASPLASDLGFCAPRMVMLSLRDKGICPSSVFGHEEGDLTGRNGTGSSIAANTCS